MITYRVTPSHHAKYKALAKELQVRFNETSYKTFGFGTFGELYALQMRDMQLETMPSSAFNDWVDGLRTFNKGAKQLDRITLICLAKHCLLEQTLGAKPKFISNAEFKL